MCIVLLSLGIVCHYIPAGRNKLPLGGKKPVDAHRSSGMDPAGRDADFGPETEPEPISKSSARIKKNACRIYLIQKFSRSQWTFCNNRIGMAATITIDVIDRILDIVDHLDRDGE